jgi:hypothetical protein
VKKLLWSQRAGARSVAQLGAWNAKAHEAVVETKQRLETTPDLLVERSRQHLDADQPALEQKATAQLLRMRHSVQTQKLAPREDSLLVENFSEASRAQLRFHARH